MKRSDANATRHDSMRGQGRKGFSSPENRALSRLERRKVRDEGGTSNESSNDLGNNGRDRLFTYATDDEVRGVSGGGGGGGSRSGCKGSEPRALFVFVGPHSVIRLRNALRPSSFPPPYPPSSVSSVPSAALPVAPVRTIVLRG